MIYVVLLRGVNVGGNNMISMAQLKAALETLGCEHVKTLGNSGNAVLSDTRSGAVLHAAIEDSLQRTFGFVIKALVLDKPAFDRVAAALPVGWRNDATMRCDVMFLWEDKDTPAALQNVPAKPGIDTVKYVDGALLWSVARHNVTKSGLRNLIGTELYRNVTIRNCNTVRKLAELSA